ncbi:MAG: type II toxin-antitoxin system death-on-curing family toxin [Chloroflexota bacterium]
MSRPPSAIEYLTADDVIATYGALFECDRQATLDVLRDPAGLESGLGRPLQWALYEKADLPIQAAVLAHAVAEGQYFLEGNKRLAFAAMHQFLLVNGYALGHDNPLEMRDWIIDLSRGLTVRELGQRIAAHVVAT